MTVSTSRFIVALMTAGALAAAAQGAITYTATLNGAIEAPPNASPGTGEATLTYDPIARTFTLDTTFRDLIGTVTVAHIHAATANPFTGTAGVATPTPTFPGFPAGVSSGTYNVTLSSIANSSYNNAFRTANGGTAESAEAALRAALDSGRAYLNIHSSAFPGGEIRGFFVPSPSAAAMLGLGGLVAMRRRR